jgi:hypothetical protein
MMLWLLAWGLTSYSFCMAFAFAEGLNRFLVSTRCLPVGHALGCGLNDSGWCGNNRSGYCRTAVYFRCPS